MRTGRKLLEPTLSPCPNCFKDTYSKFQESFLISSKTSFLESFLSILIRFSNRRSKFLEFYGFENFLIQRSRDFKILWCKFPHRLLRSKFQFPWNKVFSEKQSHSNRHDINFLQWKLPILLESLCLDRISSTKKLNNRRKRLKDNFIFYLRNNGVEI